MSQLNKILIVEDRPSWADILRKSLVEAGYVNVFLENYKDGALSRLNSEHFDIAIVDLNLKDIPQEFEDYEGVQILKQIKDLPASKRPKIILLTGYCNQEPTELIKKYDVKYFFLKSSFDKDKFVLAVHRIVNTGQK